jgi:hypothetical protein
MRAQRGRRGLISYGEAMPEKLTKSQKKSQQVKDDYGIHRLNLGNDPTSNDSTRNDATSNDRSSNTTQRKEQPNVKRLNIERLNLDWDSKSKRLYIESERQMDHPEKIANFYFDFIRDGEGGVGAYLASPRPRHL